MHSSHHQRKAPTCSTGVPKYGARAAERVEPIVGVKQQPGDALPSGPELIGRFGVSRHAVRAASGSLHEWGPIASQQGRGVIVQAVSVTPGYTHACNSIEDVLQRAAAFLRCVIGCRRIDIDEVLAEWLGCAAGYPSTIARGINLIERCAAPRRECEPAMTPAGRVR